MSSAANDAKAERRTRLDDVSRVNLDLDRALVEVGDDEGSAGEGGQEVDLNLGVEVVALAAERLVGLLLDHNDDVAGLDAGALVRLAGKRDRLALLHALVDKDLEDLALVDDLLADARLAAVLGVDDLALAVAVAALLLDLLHHRPELAEDDLDALPVARVARLDGTLLAALALALAAQHVLLQRELGRLALVQVLERDLDPVHEVLALLRALRSPAAAGPATAAEEAAAAAEELREEVLRVHAAHAAAAREALLAGLVVHLALLRAAQPTRHTQPVSALVLRAADGLERERRTRTGFRRLWRARRVSRGAAAMRATDGDGPCETSLNWSPAFGFLSG